MKGSSGIIGVLLGFISYITPVFSSQDDCSAYLAALKPIASTQSVVIDLQQLLKNHISPIEENILFNVAESVAIATPCPLPEVSEISTSDGARLTPPLSLVAVSAGRSSGYPWIVYLYPVTDNGPLRGVKAVLTLYQADGKIENVLDIAHILSSDETFIMDAVVTQQHIMLCQQAPIQSSMTNIKNISSIRNSACQPIYVPFSDLGRYMGTHVIMNAENQEECDEYLTELVRSSSFPFQGSEADKIVLLIDQTSLTQSKEIVAQLRSTKKGGGSLGWVKYQIGAQKLFDISVDDNFPQELILQPSDAQKFEQCRNTR